MNLLDGNLLDGKYTKYNSLTNENKQVIIENDYSSKQTKIDKLRKEYKETLDRYKILSEKLADNIADYTVDMPNPYLEKVVSFTNGYISFVTNKSVLKLIPSKRIWKTLPISQSVEVKLNIPWEDSYSIPGTRIPTLPPLISGKDATEYESLTLPKGVYLPEKVVPKYDSYKNGRGVGGELTNVYGLDSIYGMGNQNKQEMERLEIKLHVLSKQISKLTGQFNEGSDEVRYQSEKNVSEIDEYVKDIQSTNNKIKSVTTRGLQNILEDSDIIVLQKNYEYLFWSILASGVVLLSMNIIK
jgi:hypothetical protein